MSSSFKILGGFVLGVLAFAPLGKSAISDSLTLTDGAGDTVTVSSTGVVTFGGSCTVATCKNVASTGTDGSITFDGTLGTFSLNIDTGIDPLLLTPPSLMDLATDNVKSTAAGFLTITYTATGVTGVNKGFVMTAGGTQSDPGSVEYTAFVNSTLIGDTGAMSSNPFSSTVNSAVGSTGTYSLTQSVTLKFAGAGNDSGDFALSQIPEPTSVLLLGGAFALACGAIRRKVRQS
ncbi:MAG TPA: PEP-CTERM sorting domain-containing protein [Bryobacteraceae bacterium]|nr:PEP-CTERM sorting domain-containing protein [Bryobacteraceae bacterium]